MTAQQMLDYTFNQLDDPARGAFEHAMSLDPALADRQSRLDRRVAYLVDEGVAIEIPIGLANRTVDLVKRRRANPQPGDLAPSRSRFRLADFAVAATVFFAATLTLSVPLLRSRMQMDQTVCSSNLGKLGVSLGMYKTTHGGYPLVPASLPVGTYGLMLQDAHALEDPSNLLCPSVVKGSSPSTLPDYDKFLEIARQSPALGRTLVGGHFAYNVGYRRADKSAAPVSATAGSATPIAADGPHWSSDGRVLDGNSLNHGGRGQNVLYADGHLEWRRNRWVSKDDDDLYLNEAKLPDAGRHAADSALMPSSLPAWVR
jgi:prepilin-type processing-associated H-X9-DG protein